MFLKNLVPLPWYLPAWLPGLLRNVGEEKEDAIVRYHGFSRTRKDTEELGLSPGADLLEWRKQWGILWLSEI
jgi:hypothetical protein